ncbi:MAG: MarR family transcriptional regulator [Bacteroidetes bacterium]|nr:MarR family transcriptional regulator [Bacteroidota bacterium]
MKGEEMLLLENQLCFPLYAVSRLVTQLYTPLLDQLDITYPQYLVLLVLWEQDSQSVSDIGAQLLLETNTLTPLLKRMEQKELIQRTRATDDERKVLVSLTTRGKKLKQKAPCIPQALIAGMQDSPLTAREVEAFRRTLHKMLEALRSSTAPVHGG